MLTETFVLYFQGGNNKFSIFVHSRPGFLFNEATTRSTYFLNRQVNDSIQVALLTYFLLMHLYLLKFMNLGDLCITKLLIYFQVDWGEASMIEAERVLLRHALDDPLNDRFVFLSDRWGYNFVNSHKLLIIILFSITFWA